MPITQAFSTDDFKVKFLPNDQSEWCTYEYLLPILTKEPIIRLLNTHLSKLHRVWILGAKKYLFQKDNRNSIISGDVTVSLDGFINHSKVNISILYIMIKYLAYFE